MLVIGGLSACSGQNMVSQAGRQKEVVVFAAASLTEVCGALKEAYEADHPDVTIVYNFAGSQVLANQITEGAQPAMFFSANETYVDQLIEQKINPYDIEDFKPEKSVFASNKLVLLYPGSDDFASFDAGIEALKTPSYRPVILAFEEVPVGKYTMMMMAKYLEVTGDQVGYDRFYQQVVSYESDVKAVLAKIKIHEGDMGIVYRTDARSVDLEAYGLKALEIDDAYNMTASYGSLIFSEGLEARSFYDFVVTYEGQKILQDYGF